MAPERTDEQVVQERRDADYYCPGCGRPYGYPAQCVGSGEAPHPAIQTVDTAELGDDRDPADLTPAPNTEA